MASLIAIPPCAGLLPIQIGAASLSEETPGRVTSLMPYPGEVVAVSAALKALHGMEFPRPGRATGKAGARAVWTGQNQAMLIGPAPDPVLAKHCALTDQSDAWAVMRLEGARTRAVLARLCPLDLRAGVFRRGHTARSLLGHMNASVTRVGDRTWQIMVFRSMAQTAVHELSEAMTSVAAQAELTK